MRVACKFKTAFFNWADFYIGLLVGAVTSALAILYFLGAKI